MAEASAAVYQLHARTWLLRSPRRADRKVDLDNPTALDEALAARLVPYVRGLGFTHIELLVANTPADLPRFAARSAASGLTLLPRVDDWRNASDAGVSATAGAASAASELSDAADGDDRAWRFAALRAGLAAEWLRPGPKRLAMGAEFAHPGLPSAGTGLAWHLLADPLHEGVQRLVHDLNHLGADGAAQLVATNPSTTAWPSHRIGVALPGRYVERIATSSAHYGGRGGDVLAVWPNGSLTTEPVPWDDHPHSLVLNLPALSTSIFEGPR